MANSRVQPRFDWDAPDGIKKKYEQRWKRIESKVSGARDAEAAALACDGEDLVTTAHLIKKRFNLTDKQLVKLIYGN